MPAPVRPLLSLAALGAVGVLAACTSGAPAGPGPTLPALSTSSPPSPATTVPRSTPRPTPRSTPRPTTARAPSSAPRTSRRPAPTRPTPRTPPGQALPLAYPTGSARQVITVVAPSENDTQGRLQAWNRVRGGGWAPVGPAMPAWLGYDGMTPYPSESRSATPMGSFTLTHAFGHDPNPGTALPYLQTTPADWWVSQSGPYYNTEQRCSSGCPFTQGSPNEHLYYETPYYDHAVVIDYNTRNSPTGVRQGAGSAFFLHVSVGRPTQGCVSIAAAQLVRILRWLRPALHPRIVIGTS